MYEINQAAGLAKRAVLLKITEKPWFCTRCGVFYLPNSSDAESANALCLRKGEFLAECTLLTASVAGACPIHAQSDGTSSR